MRWNWLVNTEHVGREHGSDHVFDDHDYYSDDSDEEDEDEDEDEERESENQVAPMSFGFVTSPLTISVYHLSDWEITLFLYILHM